MYCGSPTRPRTRSVPSMRSNASGYTDRYGATDHRVRPDSNDCCHPAHSVFAVRVGVICLRWALGISESHSASVDATRRQRVRARPYRTRDLRLASGVHPAILAKRVDHLPALPIRTEGSERTRRQRDVVLGRSHTRLVQPLGTSDPITNASIARNIRHHGRPPRVTLARIRPGPSPDSHKSRHPNERFRPGSAQARVIGLGDRAAWPGFTAQRFPLWVACAHVAPLQSRTDSEVSTPAAMAGGSTGLVLCQVGGQRSGQ
jgi:hypothetical protein